MSDPSHSHGDKHDPKFSAPLFMVTVAVSLAVLCGAMAWLTPTVWQAQLQASGLALFAVFLVVHAAAGIGEFFFHRYVLHAPLVPFLSHFYKQHTLHHALTRVGFQK